MPRKSPSAPAPVVSPEIARRIQDLEHAATDMDALAQEGLSGIAAIAQLALQALERPSGHRNFEIIAQAFRAIWGAAERTQNYVHNEADEVQCGYQDINEENRFNAYVTATEGVSPCMN